MPGALDRHAAQHDAEVLVMASPSPVPPKCLNEASARRTPGKLAACFSHAEPSVAHAKGDLGTRLARHGEREHALAGELAGIAQQVKQRLLHLGLIGAEAADVGRADQLELVLVLADQRRDDRHDLVDQRPHIHLLDEHVHLAGFDFGQIEDVVDQAQQVAAGAFDLLEVLDRLGVALVLGVLPQNLAVADDRVERRPQLVAHVGEEARLGPVGLLGRIAGQLKRPLGVAKVRQRTLGRVACPPHRFLGCLARSDVVGPGYVTVLIFELYLRH